MWKEIAPHFPYPEPRECQKEAMAMILFGLKNGYKNIVLQAPVGSGKSIMAILMGIIMKPFYILTPSIGLQQQYMSEFSEHLKEVKGRGNFICDETGGSAEDAPCTRVKKNECDQKLCEYQKQKVEAMVCEGGVVSNPQYMFRITQTCQPKSDNGPTFATRNLAIFDEAHNLESIIIAFYERKLTPADYRLIGLPMIKKDKTKITTEIDTITLRVESLISDLKKSMKKSTIKNDEEEDRVERLEKLYKKLGDIGRLVRDLDNMTFMTEDCFSGGFNYIFKPRLVAKHAPWFFDRLAPQRIFVSATLKPFDMFCRNLGLNQDETMVVDVTQSPFKLENRMINCLKVGQMSRSRIDKTIEKQFEVIKQILEAHSEERGIILPFTHHIREKTAEYLSVHFPGRILTHDEKNKPIPCPACGLKNVSTKSSLVTCLCGNEYSPKQRDYIINKFLEETDGNHVLLSTYVSEGFDLGGKRNIKFLIIQKVPYPDLGALDVRERVLLEQNNWRDNHECQYKCDEMAETGEEGLCNNWTCWDCKTWYASHAVRKIQQMAGRIVRSKDDVGSIYILDTSFASLYKRYKYLFNEYFCDAVKIIDIKI